MDYNFYIPQKKQIKNLVHSFWQLEGIVPFRTERIIPKGIIEIIFNFCSDSIETRLGNRDFAFPKCLINGFNTDLIRMVMPSEKSFFGIQLQPSAVSKLFRLPGCELSNVAIDVSLIDHTFSFIWEQLAEQNDFNSRINIFANWLIRKFKDDNDLREDLVNHFLYKEGDHHLKVPELSKLLCYSSRQLSRKFHEATGLNTEEILLYKKYLHSVHLIHHSRLSLTEIAYQSCFADQSHFIRSFRAFTQMTPGQYRNTKSFAKGHIYENVR